MSDLDKEKRIRPFNFILVAFPDGNSLKYDICQKTGILEISCPATKKRCPHRHKCTLLKRIRPVAPFEKESKKWATMRWIDLSTGNPLKLEFDKETSSLAGRIHIKTYRDTITIIRAPSRGKGRRPRRGPM